MNPAQRRIFDRSDPRNRGPREQEMLSRMPERHQHAMFLERIAAATAGSREKFVERMNVIWQEAELNRPKL